MGIISKVVSGGQTGVDRAALDVAIFLKIEHGGYCPLGRRSEDGPISKQYLLTETEKRDYSIRTELNVVHSDGTLILYREKMSGGTELTFRLAKKHRRPCLAIDIEEGGQANSIVQLNDWISESNISVMNVAGPRESSSPGIGAAAELFLVQALQSNA